MTDNPELTRLAVKTAAWRAEREAWRAYKRAVMEAKVARSNCVPVLPPAILALGAAWLRAFKERRLHCGV